MDLTAKITIVTEPEGNGFRAFCPGLPGVYSDGSTEEDAVDEILPLIGLYLESMGKHGERLTNREGVVVMQEENYPLIREVKVPYEAVEHNG